MCESLERVGGCGIWATKKNLCCTTQTVGSDQQIQKRECLVHPYFCNDGSGCRKENPSVSRTEARPQDTVRTQVRSDQVTKLRETQQKWKRNEKFERYGRRQGKAEEQSGRASGCFAWMIRHMEMFTRKVEKTGWVEQEERVLWTERLHTPQNLYVETHANVKIKRHSKVRGTKYLFEVRKNSYSGGTDSGSSNRVLVRR